MFQAFSGILTARRLRLRRRAVCGRTEGNLNRVAKVVSCVLLAAVCIARITEAQQANRSGGQPVENRQTTVAKKNLAEVKNTGAMRAGTQSGQKREIDPSKEADIRRMMSLTHFDLLIRQTMNGMEGNIKTSMTNALPPGDYRDKLVDLFIKKFHSNLRTSELADRAIPVYDKHYSSAEIKELIRFYETPVGQKLLKELPAVSAELQQAGSAWGEDVGKQTMMEVLAEHPDLAKALEAAAKQSKP